MVESSSVQQNMAPLDTAQQDLALAEEAAMRDQMESLFSTKKPRDALDGFNKGASNIFKVRQPLSLPPLHSPRPPRLTSACVGFRGRSCAADGGTCQGRDRGKGAWRQLGSS